VLDVLAVELRVGQEESTLPVGPCAVEDVEEGQVGDDGDQHEGGGKGHDDDAPDELAAMHALALQGQLGEDLRDALLLEVAAGEENLVLCGAVDDFLLAARGEGGQRLQAPFLVGDALEGMVAVEGDFFLPVADGLFVLFPGGPRLIGLEGEFVEKGAVLGGFLVQLFAVDEGAAGGNGEEEETHGGRGGVGVVWCGGGGKGEGEAEGGGGQHSDGRRRHGCIMSGGVYSGCYCAVR
jgi:hypothetical protein